MKNLLSKGLASIKSTSAKLSEELIGGYSLVKEKVDGLPIFMSYERSGKANQTSFDEKHYFVIPFNLSEYKFALHTMRCLPRGVPEINNLPKRRVFHFPNEHSETQLRKYMLKSVGEIVQDKHKDKLNTLESLANDIDSLDKKLTYGMLLVGGLATVVNPILGAGIAAKALLPSMAGLFNPNSG